jgi:hypothetical protein
MTPRVYCLPPSETCIVASMLGKAGSVAVTVVSSSRMRVIATPSAVIVGSAPERSNRPDRIVTFPPLHCCVGATWKVGGLGSELSLQAAAMLKRTKAAIRKWCMERLLEKPGDG